MCIPVGSSGVLLFVDSMVIASKILMIFHLPFIMIVVVIKFWIGITLPMWTMTGIQNVFR